MAANEAKQGKDEAKKIFKMGDLLWALDWAQKIF